MILVVGSTGFLGSEICRILREEGQPVRALVRNSSNKTKVEKLEKLGAEITRGDLKDLHSLDFACHGVNTVITTATSMMSEQLGDTIRAVDLNGHLDLIDSAKRAGAKRFIYVSFVDNPAIDFPLSDAKLQVEQYLEDSALGYTILRCSWFMEAWLSPVIGFDALNHSARIYGAGYNKINWVSALDVARIIVQAVQNPRTRHKTFDIGGSDALSPMEVVALFEDMTGKKFDVEHLSELMLREQLKTETDPKKISFAGLMLQYANGIETNNRYHKYFNIQMTPVKAFAEKTLMKEHV